MPLINHAGGGGGTPQLCSQVENFKVIPGSTALSARLSWEAPTVDEDSSFVGVRIVRKTGSAPEKVSDGTVVYEGTALTYTDTGLTAGTTYYYRAFAYNAKKKYQTARRVVSLTATTITLGATLNDCTWAQIRAASAAGLAASIWSVGDTKSITLSDDLRGYHYSNYSSGVISGISGFTVDAFILGFNHNPSVEGTNRIHFHIGKQNGKQVCISSYQVTSVSSYELIMSNDSTAWTNSEMRSSILESDNIKPTSPAKLYSLLSILPADLRAVMQVTTKYTSDQTISTSSANYYATQECLPLLAPYEVFGDTIDYTGADKAKQKQYDYYKAGNSVVHYIPNDRGIGVNGIIKYTQEVYLRSSYINGSDRYYSTIGDTGIGGTGKLTYRTGTNNGGLAPIFFV